MTVDDVAQREGPGPTRIVYFDCPSGISGNMILGGLLDLGVPRDVVEENLAKLRLEPFELVTSTDERGHLRGTHVRIKPGKESVRERSFREISELIQSSALSAAIKAMSLETFHRLAEAEGRIHRQEPLEVQFHEVGALDSIVDIVGGAIGIDYLGVEGVYVSRIPLGRGMVRSRHGMLPVPVPATVELLRGVPVYDSNMEGELVTPTGAAFVTTLARGFGTLPDMEIERVGYGLGDRDFDPVPNVLRIILGKTLASLARDQVIVVETDIDDMNPEFFEPLMDKLFQRGALDVSLVAIQMKKNRPGVTVRALCEEAKRCHIVETILRESTSIGVRYYPVQREKLGRRVVWVTTPFGRVRVKISHDRAGKICHVSPEYDDCLRLSQEADTPVMEIYREALLAAKEMKPEDP